MQDPRTVYSTLLAERRAAIALRERRHQSLGYFRLAAIAAAVVIVWMALAGGTISILWVTVPGAAFVALIVIHEHLLRLLERQRRAEQYFLKGLARLDGEWVGTGEAGDRYLDPAHPYAVDLDVFGKGSLFELLCTARTHIGEDTLARWLLAAAEPATVLARQEAVKELTPRVDLREQLAVAAEEARTGLDPIALAAWGEAPEQLPGSGLRAQVWFFRVLGILGLAAGAAAVLDWMRLAPVPPQTALLLRDFALLVVLANGVFTYRRRQMFEAVVAAVEEAAHELGLMTEILVALEQQRFTSPLLSQLHASLVSDGAAPSQRLARLRRIIEYLDSRENIVVRIMEVFVLWTPYWAFEVEQWRRQCGAAVRRWFTAMGEIEALCSLASHAFEHPADPFPAFTPGSETGPWLEADAIAHPLLPEDRAIPNDIRLGGELRLLVVSGSNMSGKSTMMRTLGTNAVLAQAGGTVRARRLRLSPLAIGASIRVSDSLQGGVSRFYAEILRLRQILDQTAGPLPVMFLIDEFLNGTNSHDRRIGAEALVRRLVDRGAIGLITTHDLALAEIADALGERARNVHFEDHIENGQIHFDYVMRPGIVRKSNAIELMRSVGLEI